MTAHLILARVGAGKTETVQNRLLALKRDQPLAKIWVLLATERQVIDFRRRLIERADRPVLFNVEFFNFYTLYEHLLDRAGQPARGIDETTRDGLIRLLLSEQVAAGKLPVFAPIAHTPGLIRVVGDFIYELKQNLVKPEVFSDGVTRLGAAPKMREVVALYAAYQARLIQHNIVDREGQGWLAQALVVQDPAIANDVDLLIVDGYDQFTVLQAELLAALAGRASETVITLTDTGDDLRAETIGRRFKRARERLESIFDEKHIALEPLSAESTGVRAPTLRHLAAHLLEVNAPTLPADDALSLLEAPDMPSEAAAVVRRVKRLLLSGANPDHVLIALRDYEGYAPHLETAARRVGVPLLLHRGEPIDRNPALVALLDALNLHAIDFRKRELLDVLRSPYLQIPDLDAAAVDTLESVGALVVSGRDEWDDALAAAARTAAPPSDDEDDAPDSARLTADDAARLQRALTALFDAVTPPERGTLPHYIVWLEGVIGVDAGDPADADDGGRAAALGLPTVALEPIVPAAYTLNLPLRVRDAAAPSHLIGRDLAAIRQLKRRLSNLLKTDALFASLKLPRETTRADFIAELRAAVESAAVGTRGARDGRVLVTSATDARGLPHKHVFILGVSEGMFPAAPPEDRLLLESERKALRAAGVAVGLREERADDDGVFYELINLAAESLTLSRPYTIDGSILHESHLWSAVKRLFDGLAPTRYTIGAVVPAAEVASPADALLTAMAQPDAEPLREWLQTHQGDLWARVGAAAAVESARIAARMDGDFAVYAGVLRAEALIARAAAAVSARTWSASQLNELGTCAFRFFAHRMLNVEEQRQPDAGMDVLQRGSVFHEILETVYARLAADGVTLTADNLDTALAILDAEAPPILAVAPLRHGFRPTPTWANERTVIVRQIRALIQADFTTTTTPSASALGAQRRVESVERAFNVMIPIIDANGTFGDGTLQVRGVIDRIDTANGQHFILDYKTGTTKIPLKLTARGRNVQMAVYWLAARALGLNAVGGAFWHIGSRDFSGEIADNTESNEALEGARRRLTRMVSAAARGDFAAEPNGREDGQCAKHCDYAQLCRIAVRERRARPTANDANEGHDANME
ncbi:MAG: PD-(D/E)XK nuclease family protein [Chloroflexota bacterium]|nr:PD-(D/E)XK nuclease family protein [Chloroflexota bacterium]